MKIYDCFTFFNELELLELRLKTLDNTIDYFVIVEANKTHKNKEKEFIFEANKEKFVEYLDKIRYIKIEDMPDFDPINGNEWELENYQRNCITRGLKDCSPEDLILISDIDEIPNPFVIRSLNDNTNSIKFLLKLLKNTNQPLRLLRSLFKHHRMTSLNNSPLTLQQELFYYFVNCRSNEYWNGSVITKAKNFSTPQQLRNLKNEYPKVKNSGWHFSYLGGVERILLKINSIVEGTANKYSDSYIQNCINNGLDIYGRKGKEFEYEIINIDNKFPEYIHTLIKKYPLLYFKKSSF